MHGFRVWGMAKKSKISLYRSRQEDTEKWGQGKIRLRIVAFSFQFADFKEETRGHGEMETRGDSD